MESVGAACLNVGVPAAAVLPIQHGVSLHSVSVPQDTEEHRFLTTLQGTTVHLFFFFFLLLIFMENNVAKLVQITTYVLIYHDGF